jgi:TOBE domain
LHNRDPCASARALACEPAALLLDGPLAALDVQTRAEVQGELREHLAGFAGPTLLVTRDPIEALLLATRTVVLEQGRVAQQGTPAEITSRPATPYVARLVGMNLYAGDAADGVVALDGGGTLVVPDAGDGHVLVALRPSALTVYAEEPHGSSARNLWSATITAFAPLGDRIRLTATGEQNVFVDLTASAVADLGLVPGQRVWVTAKATDLVAYPAPWHADLRARHHRALLGRRPARRRTCRRAVVRRHGGRAARTVGRPRRVDQGLRGRVVPGRRPAGVGHDAASPWIGRRRPAALRRRLSAMPHDSQAAIFRNPCVTSARQP